MPDSGAGGGVAAIRRPTTCQLCDRCACLRSPDRIIALRKIRSTFVRVSVPGTVVCDWIGTFGRSPTAAFEWPSTIARSKSAPSGSSRRLTTAAGPPPFRMRDWPSTVASFDTSVYSDSWHQGEYSPLSLVNTESRHRNTAISAIKLAGLCKGASAS
jgi:hypothetical protein